MDQLARLDPRLDFPGGSDGKATAYNAGDPGCLLPGRPPGFETHAPY